uniref:Uncharacterized protein n=1 Tax=Zea mays TaxID=4577 RepID=A0A804M917_MAIZE
MSRRTTTTWRSMSAPSRPASCPSPATAAAAVTAAPPPPPRFLHRACVQVSLVMQASRGRFLITQSSPRGSWWLLWWWTDGARPTLTSTTASMSLRLMSWTH